MLIKKKNSNSVKWGFCSRFKEYQKVATRAKIVIGKKEIGFTFVVA